jgi:uncharacterized protein
LLLKITMEIFKFMKTTFLLAFAFLFHIAYGTDSLSYTVSKNQMVPMRDGVLLATDIYFPKGFKGKLPVIFHRTPYNKEKGIGEVTQFFCKHGYIVIFQDCRGRYQSQGSFIKYVNEPQDGYDAVEWIAQQPWSNGKIGMRGGSYGAHVQAGAAKLNPPHLSTIVCTVGGTSNGWDHAIRNHGAYALKQITWAFSNLRNETEDPVVKEMMENENVADWFTALPLKKGCNPLSVSPEFEDYVLNMWQHGDYDDYWKQMGFNWMEYYGQTSDIPMMHMSGWYDNYCQTAIDNYLGLSKIKKSPIRLLIGPWMHGTTDLSYAGDVDFGQGSLMLDYYFEWHLKWYNCYLKGEKNEISKALPVKVFVMGTGDGHKDENGRLFHGGYWKSAEAWPFPGTRNVNYYMYSDGSLSDQEPGNDEKPVTYTFDPSHPVPTIGGSMAASKPLWVGGAFHQREKPFEGDPEKGFYGSREPYLPLKARKDILVYQTAPLERDVTVAGPIVVKLHASSDALDTDFTAKLIDVYPPSKDFPEGFEMNITDGIIRARYRDTPEKAQLMEPGEVYEFVIEPFSTANVFKKGHRIRLDISSSNFPRFDVNPNTGEPLGKNIRMQKANNTIYHSQMQPSYIILPIIDEEGNLRE